jgi:Amt family ammonium transporter
MGIGVGAGVICWIFVTLIKAKLGYDDSLDAFGVHGVGGIWGALATGLWATKAVNVGGNDGFFAGNPKQLLVQAAAVGVTMVFSFVGSLVLLRVVNTITPLRVEEHEERVGLDLTEHREAGYTLID